MIQTQQPRYDIPTAITFFLAGLGIGSLLAIVMGTRDRPELPASLHELR